MNEIPLKKPVLSDYLIAALIAISALVVYSLTLTPSLSYLSPDGSELATVPYVLGLAHSPGYPFYTWLGYLFTHLLPLGDVAHRVNLMSAIMGAMSAGGLYLIAVQLLPIRLPGRRAAAALGALLFAFSVDQWLQSLIAEVYAPNIALVALTLLALLAWERKRRTRDFFLFALAFGLSLGTHISNLGFAPAFIFFILLTVCMPSEMETTHSAARFFELIQLAVSGGIGFALGALQFLWLPLRAGSLNDRAMLRNTPITFRGLYNYTLGAFPNFKFAFPIFALPDRLVLYLDLLRQQFGLIGIFVGIAGLFYLLFTRPRHFFLLVGMYLVHVWFFIQYSAFDLEVFFIPAHFLWAVFIGFGFALVYQALQALLVRLPGRHKLPGLIVGLLVGLVVLLIGLIPLRANWAQNDLSQDTAINDFYANIWEVLPRDSVLLTPGGVFGYDAFYWQLVYETRPDITLPAIANPDPKKEDLEDVDLYATTPALQNNRGPGALPPNILSDELWETPILFGEQPVGQGGRRGSLVLYHLTEQPPQLVEIDPHPQIEMRAEIGPAILVGADVGATKVENGARIKLTLYWRIQPGARLRVNISLGDQPLEEHEVGFGLLGRYAREFGVPPNGTIVERYELVIPSTIPAGEWPLTIGAVDLRAARQNTTLITHLDVVDETETMERWLQIARSSSSE